jgi:hypothetical protein
MRSDSGGFGQQNAVAAQSAGAAVPESEDITLEAHGSEIPDD